MPSEYGYFLAKALRGRASPVASDAKEEEHKLTAKISGLSHEQRKIIFYSLGLESIWEGES